MFTKNRPSKHTNKAKPFITATLPFKELPSYAQIFSNPEPRAAFRTGKIMAKAWMIKQPSEHRLSLAKHFMVRAIEKYWKETHHSLSGNLPLPKLFETFPHRKLDNAAIAVAEAIGQAAAELSLVEAGYQLGTVYTALLPEDIRTAGWVFYTPPGLVDRLLDMAEEAGIDWQYHTILDPACGGGAFLAPICLRMLGKLKDEKPEQILKHIQTHVQGWEIDAFSAWMTQVFVEVALKEVIAKSRSKIIAPLVKVQNSLLVEIESTGTFDLVIGNPPYGKIKQTPALKERFSQSLHGHPNLYGVFTQLAIELCRPSGVIAFVTPTSWLSGEYFKKLRQFVRTACTPVEADFIVSRKGVFDDALQEIMLYTLKKTTSDVPGLVVQEIDVHSTTEFCVRRMGKYPLAEDHMAPWILPRHYEERGVVAALSHFSTTLKDLGYQVSTGPLVWNRHKPQFTDHASMDSLPVVWAESITAEGRFVLKAEKNNHQPYFKSGAKDAWLITRHPCILLQRTTAKEQEKRLMAAPLPKKLYKHGVVIENHLNMIIPINDTPTISLEVLAALLNSRGANQAFKCISGSVAVSAYELESMPLPAVDEISYIQTLIDRRASPEEIDNACNQLYRL